MKFSDILRLAFRNLREARLRAGLTTIGVLVGVAVIVTMVSFGLGLQRNTVQRFKDLDLFNEISVTGRSVTGLIDAEERRRRRGGANANENTNANQKNDNGDSRRAPATRVLDDEAIREIARTEGVASVEPHVQFATYVRANGRARVTSIGGALVPNTATRFKQFSSGRMIERADSAEAVVDESFLREFGFEKPADAVGKAVELLSPADDEKGAKGGEPGETQGEKESASDGREGEGADAPGGEEGAPMTFFGLPLEDESEGERLPPGLVARPFVIAGVLKTEVEGGGRSFRGMMPVSGIYVPLGAAREWTRTHRGSLAEVAVELARASGELKEGELDGYPAAVVRVNDPGVLSDVQKKLRESGFGAFSVADQLKELRTVFLILNSALGLLGGISLLVASLGIANTMIMSILERTREIGIMKAIGAEDREIKLIFFVEAALIGLTGGVAGCLVAWGIDATANRLAYRFILRPRGVSYVSFFALPPYLWLGAIAFAVAVAIAVALYPAARAARIDPVKALRHD
jgi:putative ABC transport system permease protein